MPHYPCCEHCLHLSKFRHSVPCARCQAFVPQRATYVEVADANPERANNGCLIYTRGA